MSTRTFNADYRRGIRKADKARGSEHNEYTVARLINTLAHFKALKALGETPYGMQRAEQHVASATLAARLRVLHFAFIALEYPRAVKREPDAHLCSGSDRVNNPRHDGPAPQR